MTNVTLSERAMLVSLNISQWSARKFDKRASAQVASVNHVGDNIARVNKNLLPAGEALEVVHKKTTEIRNIYLKHTMPWLQGGMQILKSSEFVAFTRMMSGLAAEWRQLVAQFVDAYPQMRRDARVMLNGLFDDADYPETWAIGDKFSIDVVYLPVPDVRDWRIDIGDVERERLETEVLSRLKQANAGILEEAWRRVYEVVSRAHERLSGPDNIFRDTLVDNAIELCRLLPGLNITDDPKLEQMRRSIEGSLCKYNPGTLRADPAVRSDVADKMAELMAKMGGLYGTPQAQGKAA